MGNYQESPITGHACFLGPRCDLWHRTGSVSITCGSYDATGMAPAVSNLEWKFNVSSEEVDLERIHSELSDKSALAVKCYLEALRQNAPIVYGRYIERYNRR